MDGPPPPFTIQRSSASCVEPRSIPHGYFDSSSQPFHTGRTAKIVKNALMTQEINRSWKFQYVNVEVAMVFDLCK